jgi:hypothetical protein
MRIHYFMQESQGICTTLGAFNRPMIRLEAIRKLGSLLCIEVAFDRHTEWLPFFVISTSAASMKAIPGLKKQH